MLNFVTEPKGDAGAVLIRALEPVAGLELMRARRGKKHRDHELTNGPGKLCNALGILLSHNGVSLNGPEIRVWDDGYRVEKILASPRVGISQGTEHYWRFFIEGHSSVSRCKENKMARPVSRVA
jgi:DNA-3-methyladenine glycosylase